MAWKQHAVDGGLLRFDRASGTNLLRRGPDVADRRREAPRTLQIGLLTPCNLACSFCYRDRAAPSRLTREFLVDLLVEVDRWGVVEVAFGGGEPLLFKGFAPLLRELHARTRLGLNFTTNGVLLTDDVIAQIDGIVGEVRISAYPDNDYRATLRRARRLRPGVNFLVTPATVGLVEASVHDFFDQGAANVLLLGYKGDDRRLHLDARGLDALRRAVDRMRALPLRLDICWYPHLPDAGHMFERGDCGAGDEFLVITPDRAVQPCSFHHQRIPFDSFDELRAIYARLRDERAAARTGGCTREQFVPIGARPVAEPTAWLWQAHASNNSGDVTIIARFCDEPTARRAAESLRELSRAHDAYLASAEGQDHDPEHATPPLHQFAAAHGFSWSPGDGLWWEEAGAGASTLTAGAVGDAVVVFHPYCMGLPDAPFRDFFQRVGATEFASWDSDRPRVVGRARGGNPAARRQLEAYVSAVCEEEHPDDVDAPPPWGREARDQRLLPDEDRSAELDRGDHEISISGDAIVLSLAFRNTFAGALALHRWLTGAGFTDIAIEIEAALEALPAHGEVKVPQLGLFGGSLPTPPPWELTPLDTVPDRQVVEWLFDAGQPSDAFHARLESIDRAELLAHATGALQSRPRNLDAAGAALWLARVFGAPMAPLVRSLWDVLPATGPVRELAASALVQALPADEAFDRARRWLRAAATPDEALARLGTLRPLGDRRLLPEIEQLCGGGDTGPIEALAAAVAAARANHRQLAAWIGGASLLLSRVAVRTMHIYSRRGAPEDYGQTDTASLTALLEGYRAREQDPAVAAVVDDILAYPTALVSDSEAF